MFGSLYIVSTPIGNLQDISLRAARTLLTSRIIVCEDTRRTGLLLQEIAKLFNGYEERTRPMLISFYDEIEEKKMPEIIQILKTGSDISLVSDAGTPLVSDPGFKLIRECVSENINIVSIPGPSSVITSLVISGLPTDKFFFAGYPPKKLGHRLDFYSKLKNLEKIFPSTIIIFEAPHKMIVTLNEIEGVFGAEEKIVITRELTKIHEEIFRGSVKEAIDKFRQSNPRGEFVILLHPDK